MPSSTESEKSERLDLARRLHDGPAQELMALGFEVDSLIGEPTLAPSHRSRLRELRLAITRISESFRDEIYLLRRTNLAELPFRLRAILPERELELSLPLDLFKAEVEDVLSLVIQEIARNSFRHSCATSFKIDHEIIGGEVQIRVSENGTGEITLRERSFGLRMISEAIEALGGSVQWQSDSSGSVFIIRIPR